MPDLLLEAFYAIGNPSYIFAPIFRANFTVTLSVYNIPMIRSIFSFPIAMTCTIFSVII